MSELPPTIDAILESIRARVTGDGELLPPLAEPAPPQPTPPPPSPVDDPGEVVLSSGITLDALMQKMLEPMLQSWLDARLPEIVERVARAEIKRIAGL
ncbi:hypothetical protein GCM10007973_27370 [Polymorphobacter multimanifer]|uniref:DUF2497 domain-containing protein n=1 Tax=Polymorphobacter multimanifer TaxID=1070431 RepID=A0A841LCG4_9SPHN|nr:DUF2497 domain-containing protein [Polymorphobacter multimanifer]MBB6229401.1 hypothetical protein [Polymorphobacter multimanifer]GGI89568.1 hypothetical protein GCM10007973_27370 [Polymorphobacter multimanifer]